MTNIFESVDRIPAPGYSGHLPGEMFCQKIFNICFSDCSSFVFSKDC